MKYTEHGLRINIAELRQLVERIADCVEHDDMEPCVYIQGGPRPTITQYCNYKECSPINHTYLAK